MSAIKEAIIMLEGSEFRKTLKSLNRDAPIRLINGREVAMVPVSGQCVIALTDARGGMPTDLICQIFSACVADSAMLSMTPISSDVLRQIMSDEGEGATLFMRHKADDDAFDLLIAPISKKAIIVIDITREAVEKDRSTPVAMIAHRHAGDGHGMQALMTMERILRECGGTVPLMRDNDTAAQLMPLELGRIGHIEHARSGRMLNTDNNAGGIAAVIKRVTEAFGDMAVIHAPEFVERGRRSELSKKTSKRDRQIMRRPRW